MNREARVGNRGAVAGGEIATPNFRLPAQLFGLAFGLFFGLCLWKFGNPVILDHKIDPPATFAEFRTDAWPTHWANWIFLPLALAGAGMVLVKKARWPGAKWLWLPPLLWLGWQCLSATNTVDAGLTRSTLPQFTGCVAAWFLGVFLLGHERALKYLLIGVLAAFAFCLMRAIDQRLVEFPQSRQMLVEGERTGWTNIPPPMLLELKRDQIVIVTNGLEVANPAVLDKFARDRVMGTLVYPNALAGAILLLLPISLSLASGAKNLRPAIRGAAVGLAALLGGAGLFWSGSKLGWLMVMALGALYLFRLDWPMKLKIAALAAIVVVGLGIFTVRFHHYFATGATSVGARFDYWRAAAETAASHPFVGTGPGTFQRPYEQIKSPDAEMARLTHNDYLEQFSDSGIPGGLFYLIWVVSSLAAAGRAAWTMSPHAVGEAALRFAMFAGVLAWFAQGLAEFGLYIPALAWTAFALLGILCGATPGAPVSDPARIETPPETRRIGDRRSV